MYKNKNKLSLKQYFYFSLVNNQYTRANLYFELGRSFIENTFIMKKLF